MLSLMAHLSSAESRRLQRGGPWFESCASVSESELRARWHVSPSGVRFDCVQRVLSSLH